MNKIKIKSVVPNYRKKVLEICLQTGRANKAYNLPFSAFKGMQVGVRNPFTNISVEKDLASQSVSFILQNGKKGDFHADFVLYHCEPNYDWSPINQLKKTLKDRLREANISVRLLAKALNTSPSQVERLLKAGKSSKQLLQLSKVAEMAGLHLDFTLKERKPIQS